MTTYSQLPLAEWQIIAPDGGPAVGYLANTYLPNTTTPVTTYQDAAGMTANTNPIVMDSNGMAIVFSNVAVRIVLTDSLGNQIYDRVTYPSLPVTAISAAMAPVVAAGSLAEAREDLGVTSAIATAIAGVDLLPGPPGATGAQGIQGIQGNDGPSGAGYAPQLNGNNPGYFLLPNTNGSVGFYFQNGVGTTNNSGSAIVNFATSFPNGCLNVQLTIITSVADASIQLREYDANSITVTTSGIGFPGGGFSGPVNFSWLALGY